MQRAFQFSIALSLFLIVFASYPTRIDDAFKAFSQTDPLVVGDIVLVSGASIVIGLLAGVASLFRK